MNFICDHSHLLIRYDNPIHIHSLYDFKRKNKNKKIFYINFVNSNLSPISSIHRNKNTKAIYTQLLKKFHPYNFSNNSNSNNGFNFNPRIPPKSSNFFIILIKIQETKNNPILKIVKVSLLDLPSPTSISFLWNIGFLLGIVLTLQIITGLILSMIYTAQTESAFKVIVIIIRDINTGWITRIIHINGASLFFILLYIHTARGIYFSSPSNKPKVWISGVVILLLIIATAFLGYVLPWGQMSFWGATVITGVLSAIPIIGNDLVTWIWGGPSVSQPTLNRFFSLHFLLPIVIIAIVLVHLIFLHEKGSSNPSNSHSNLDKIKFNPLFSTKDTTPIIMIIIIIIIINSNYPNILGDVENFNIANPLVAPIHIQPEWYFLFAYVILRSIPSKLGGVIALVASILIISILVIKKNKSTKFKISKKAKFWLFASVVLILTWIGAKTVERPYEEIGQIYTFLYFSIILTL